ncbi:MAG: glycosyltransferase [Okeania sp. SIO2C9]|uniref:glycosyltransferase n=1 Tax=Okeania sp. SIO2C9 TaxID=2607791 RepID=UPI0013C0E0B6|nr:glycosyltransferase [Okeania sp. SIO2C9]NEQ77919.1 glycosyltransferase [Okeania sp. SIO2C9]
MIAFKSNSSLKETDILVLSPTPTYPINQGNRKRIYSVCQQLQNRGAKIHFLHYPQDIVAHIPSQWYKEMTNQWYSFHSVPTTRPVQTPAIGEDHLIDEWWDRGLEDYLKWLFQHNYYDAFIVNYTYLSKAFEFAPSYICCILDTHDQFTGRRQLLESQGISPEFFHTTADQETIALERSDLVWAIKEQEAVFFREIAKTPVCTMLHIEPENLIQRFLRPEDEDYLVIGMIGVGNSINTTNARAFLEQVRPLFVKYLAPIKIKFAGSLCENLQDLEDVAGIELMGRVETVDEFYQAVDVAIVPMSFSTGLKIKAVEALATGLPIIAHRHAFEGIPSTNPYHNCESLVEIGEKCLELAFEPSQLSLLAEATKTAYTQMKSQVENAINLTTDYIFKSKTFIIIIINHQFFVENSPEYDHTLQTINYLKNLAHLIYYVDTPLDRKKAKRLHWYDREGRVILSPHAARASGLKDEQFIDHSSLLGISCAIWSLEELCTQRQIIALWLMEIPAEFQSGIPYSIQNIPIYALTDVLRSYTQPGTDGQTIKCLKDCQNLTLVNSSLSATYLESSWMPNAKIAIVPYWRQQPWKVKERWANTPDDHKRVIILVVPQSLELAQIVWGLCCKLFPESLKPIVFLAKDEQLDKTNRSSASWQQDSQFLQNIVSVSDLYHNIIAWDRTPWFVVDLSCEHLAFAIYRETILRIGVLRILPQKRLSSLVQEDDLKPASGIELVKVLGRLASDREYLAQMQEKTYQNAEIIYANDAGWSRIWREVTEINRIVEEED